MRAPAAVLAALALLATLAPAGAAPGDPSELAGPIPEGLPGAFGDLAAALGNVSEAESVGEARRAHGDVQPAAADAVPHAPDLAGREGRLLATYLDRLDDALSAGDLDDARSLAAAADDLVREELRPAAERWSENRTAVRAGPARPDGEGLVLPVVLVNPPPGGVGAFDVEVSTPEGAPRPVSGSLAAGRGETRADEANRSVRLAAFQPGELAQLAPERRVATLGEVRLGGPVPEAPVPVDARVHQLATPDGERVPALGLATESAVLDGDAGTLAGLPERWVGLGLVVALAGATALAARRRLEV